MSQQSILGRITQLARANIHALLDQAEDPQVMLDQLLRDYTSNISEAEAAIAQTIGNLRLLEQDAQEAGSTAKDWGTKAAAASKQADALRASGSAEEADRFDTLARIALQHQIEFEAQAAAFTPVVAEQSDVVARLKEGLDGMKTKLEELRRKRNELVSRSRVAEAQTAVRDAIRTVDVLDPTSEISRFEQKVRREEARVAGQAELDASSLDAQFESLTDAANAAEVEARLEALKANRAA